MKSAISNQKSLIIGWLYPDLMNTYGDTGNITVIKKRCLWRGINAEIKSIGLNSNEKDLLSCDLLLMGGAQDTQQEIVAKDLKRKKDALKETIEKGIPGLYICGGFQYLGNYYKTADGHKLEQLGVLDMYTENPGRKRLIGNIAVETEIFGGKKILLGFENHGGRTVLGKTIVPLGKVLKGFGSNDKDKEEGAVYKNTIGTYFHGPILPKNPFLADYLIKKALEIKYGEEISLEKLNDELAEKARKTIAKRLSIAI